MLDGDSTLRNEPVVPVAELRLLAKTREGHYKTRERRYGERTRFFLFVSALLVIGFGLPAGRHFYSQVESGAQVVKTVSPEQPLSQSVGLQTETVAQRNQISTERSYSSPPAANAAELSNGRLETVVRDLAAVQSSVQQLVAKQEEITRNLAELQKGKNVRPALSAQRSRPGVAGTTSQPPGTLRFQSANPIAKLDVQQPSTSTATQVLRPPSSIPSD